MSDWKPSYEDVHLLKKDLIARQLRKELSLLFSGTTTVAALTDADAHVRFPLLAPLFTRMLLQFPPLKSADEGPAGAWKIFGAFIGKFSSVDSGGTALHLAKRDLLANKLLDGLAAMLGKAVRTNTEIEQPPTHPTTTHSHGSPSSAAVHTFDQIAVTEARVAAKKGFWRSSESVQFVITSSLNGRVRTTQRDYAAFKALHKELIRRKNLSVPPLPMESTSASSLSATQAALATYLQHLGATPTATLRDFLNQSEPLEHASGLETDDGSEKRAEEIEIAMNTFRDELLAPGGLEHIFKTLGEAQEVAELPQHYQKAVEWWKICMAATLYRTFVTDDRAAEHQRRLKSFHQKAPYRSWAALLKGTNAVMIVKAIGSLLLAKPFGSKCLLQSILTSTIDEEIVATSKEIDYVLQLLGGDPARLRRANEIVNGGPPGGYTAERARDLPFEVLGGTGYPEDDPERMAAEKLLGLLWQYRRMNQLRCLVAEDIVVDLARTLLSVSYKPLAEAYKATDPGSFVRDGAKLLEDLIKLVEVEQAKARTSPEEEKAAGAPLQPFLVLLARHEQRIYKHVHNTISTNPTKVEALTDIANWADDVAKFFNGVGPTIDLVAVVQHESAHIDMAGLQADIEKLKTRKRDREAKRWARIVDRVRGFVRSTALDDELDEPAHANTLRMQGVWESAPSLEPSQDPNSLGVPRSMHRSKGSIASFESLGSNADAPSSSGAGNGTGANADIASIDATADDAYTSDTLPDMEAQIRALFLNDVENDSGSGDPDPYIPTWTVEQPSPAAGGSAASETQQQQQEEQPPLPPRTADRDAAAAAAAAAQPRQPVWNDPAQCTVTPLLLDPWIAALQPWLEDISSTELKR
ncbi:hypothetical protein HDU87_002063 [Geranomyces variabilis]|uniref:PX domain-containing protein n=1 Tax=Geranomyces variabilis TaxID=109894 RepID=A0AAD5TD43_9FUNG|nr:hypothetical protein HDU87_002063 [Geranomyces variabilis]